jgi:hypothetical protein
MLNDERNPNDEIQKIACFGPSDFGLSSALGFLVSDFEKGRLLKQALTIRHSSFDI